MQDERKNVSRLSAMTKATAGAVVAALLVLPFVLSQFGSAGEYWIWVTTEMLIMGLFAMSLNLILGYGGMVSFGHAAFFGVGAYTVALLTTKADCPLWLALPASLVTAGIAAAVIGAFCVRLIGLYFSILTLAFGQLLFMVAFQWRELTGGDDGIRGILRPDWLGPVNYYLFCLVIFLVCYMVMRTLVNSSFGLTIRSVRENMERAKFIGVNVRRYQWLNFIIAGAFAGLAGGLMTELHRLCHTGYLHWTKSADPILASLVGGMYSLWGPAVGAAVLKFLEVIVQRIHPKMIEVWALVLGPILLIVVLFAPTGLAGLYKRITGKTQG